jgi:hypothetical protein
MSTITWVGAAALLVAAGAAGQIPPAADWDRADAETVRLAPGKVDGLPLPIRQGLAQLGCTIPQVFGSGRPGNFVTGRFSSPSQTDVAVLCSRNRMSSILVFAQGSPHPIAEFAEKPDKNFLQDIGNGRIGFSRLLGVAHPQAIRDYYAAYGGPELPPLDHDGVEESFLEKASIVWYSHEGMWLQLTGAD